MVSIYIYLYGFRSKFSNDERQQDNTDELSISKKLDIIPKLSGFLGQVIIFPYNNLYYAIICSKNSTGKDNKYSTDANRIVKKWLTEDLLETLGKDMVIIRLYFYVERCLRIYFKCIENFNMF